jgi:hypothetical protein
MTFDGLPNIFLDSMSVNFEAMERDFKSLGLRNVNKSEVVSDFKLNEKNNRKI